MDFTRKTTFPGLSALCLAGLLISCSAPGPTVPLLEAARPAVLPERLFFLPKHPFFRRLNLGMLTTKPIRQRGTGKRIRTAFFMQVLGQMADGSVRIRSYEGDAWQDAAEPDAWELASKRCYTFGKRFWEDRLRPLERWNCDHLVFRLRRTEDGTWTSYIDERSLRTSWFGTLSLSAPEILNKQHYFSGRVVLLASALPQKAILKTPAGIKSAPLDGHIPSKLPSADAVIWGKDAGLLLRDGQILRALDRQGQEVGRLRILARPGDTVLAKWISRSASQAKAVYVYTNQAPKSGPGLF